MSSRRHKGNSQDQSRQYNNPHSRDYQGRDDGWNGGRQHPGHQGQQHGPYSNTRHQGHLGPYNDLARHQGHLGPYNDLARQQGHHGRSGGGAHGQGILYSGASSVAGMPPDHWDTHLPMHGQGGRSHHSSGMSSQLHNQEALHRSAPSSNTRHQGHHVPSGGCAHGQGMLYSGASSADMPHGHRDTHLPMHGQGGHDPSGRDIRGQGMLYAGASLAGMHPDHRYTH